MMGNGVQAASGQLFYDFCASTIMSLAIICCAALTGILELEGLHQTLKPFYESDWTTLD